MSSLTKTAHSTLGFWSLQLSGELIAHQEQPASVFEARSLAGTFFLRLSPLWWRSREAVACELAFLAHLHQHGCRVAQPVATKLGATSVEAEGHTAVLFEAASGHQPGQDDPDWKMRVLPDWGRTLALQHVAAQDFVPPVSSWRDDWRVEPVFAEGLARLQRNDPKAAKAADDILNTVENRADSFGPTGFIHADFAPQNYRYQRNTGLTVFDFDNCVRHWQAYDLAVAVSILMRSQEGEESIQRLVEGYQEIAPLPCARDALQELVKLRVLYVLCDRICAELRVETASSHVIAKAHSRLMALIPNK
ncbi:hypothetical protein E2K80_18860 [Rhodophyticola sp. CCM32]|uniref:phosphotransferase enzyme family protein n=1 Tax=Rhodophyticola sp. CCM32 TaxID=2916397 RepID=UPI00107F6643|nr:phosphotransferase [Rhodophyticola sp. CCM32]QBY02544.1 hypothetical protein E2K80_18860 [Rhodophyticola sp. CCM32]